MKSGDFIDNAKLIQAFKYQQKYEELLQKEKYEEMKKELKEYFKYMNRKPTLRELLFNSIKNAIRPRRKNENGKM